MILYVYLQHIVTCRFYENFRVLKEDFRTIRKLPRVTCCCVFRVLMTSCCTINSDWNVPNICRSELRCVDGTYIYVRKPAQNEERKGKHRLNGWWCGELIYTNICFCLYIYKYFICKVCDHDVKIIAVNFWVPTRLRQTFGVSL